MNKSVKPRVSVLMPAYNHERFVEQAVRSVWDQTAMDIELIVVDDGSKDSTPAILRELCASSPIPMAVSVQPNAGVSATLNRAFAQAKGEWIAILASDDFYGPDFIKRNLEIASAHGRDDVIQHSDAFLVEHDGQITGRLDQISPRAPLQSDAFDLLANGGGRLLPISMFARKDLLQSVGFCDPSLVNEDYDLHLRLARAGRFEYINEPLVYSRHTPGSLGKQPWLFGDSVIVALRKHSDRLGDRLPEILRKRSLTIASTCFEYGRPGHGLKWGARAVRYSANPWQGLRSAFSVSRTASIGLTRYGARALLGRDRLVRLKRRITRL